MVGLFTIWQGPDNATCKELGIHKRNEVLVGFSRDGFHWSRLNRDRFLAVSEDPKDWNGANVQSVGGGCVVVGDQLYFYCSGRTMHPRKSAATGLALLRRDGFAGMKAGKCGGTLTTRKVVFSGERLFVNTDAEAGELKVEVLDAEGKVVEPFSRENCIPVETNSTKHKVAWKDAGISTLQGQVVRFRFHLEEGFIYSFWVSPTPDGTSHGFVAGGGPKYPGGKDR